jgi:hypothetical protein
MKFLRCAIGREQVMAEICLAARVMDADRAEVQFAQSWDAGQVGAAIEAGFTVGAAGFHQGQDMCRRGLAYGDLGGIAAGAMDTFGGLFIAVALPPATALVLGSAVAVGNLYRRFKG